MSWEGRGEKWKRYRSGREEKGEDVKKKEGRGGKGPKITTPVTLQLQPKSLAKGLHAWPTSQMPWACKLDYPLLAVGCRYAKNTKKYCKSTS
jgi:hypothetical protein